MAYQKKSTSKSKSSKASKASEETVVAAAVENTPECCKSCDEKIESLEKSIAALESKLKGLIEGIEAASKLKAELDEAKLKLGAEVKELKESAKSWATKAKEAVDSNQDGKIDFEEIYSYIVRRKSSRNPKPRK